MTEHSTGFWDVCKEFVVQLPQILTAVGVMVVGWFSYKGQLIARQSLIQGQENHKAMNSRLSELVEEKAKSAHAEGVIAGTRTEQDRIAGVAATPVTIVSPSPLPVTITSAEERLEQIRGQDQ